MIYVYHWEFLPHTREQIYQAEVSGRWCRRWQEESGGGDCRWAHICRLFGCVRQRPFNCFRIAALHILHDGERAIRATTR